MNSVHGYAMDKHLTGSNPF